MARTLHTANHDLWWCSRVATSSVTKGARPVGTKERKLQVVALACHISNGASSFAGDYDTHTYIHSAVMGKDSVTSFDLMNFAPKSSSGLSVPVVFKNDSQDTVELLWHSYSGALMSYGKTAAGQSHSMNTYPTHPLTINDTHSIENQPVWITSGAYKYSQVEIIITMFGIIWNRIRINLQESEHFLDATDSHFLSSGRCDIKDLLTDLRFEFPFINQEFIGYK